MYHIQRTRSTGGYKGLPRYTNARRKADTAARQLTARAVNRSLYRGDVSPMEVAAAMAPAHGYPGGAMTSEFKAIDVANATVVQDTVGSVTLINGCQMGSDINNRIGRQFQMRSVELHGLTFGTPATGIDQVHRVLLVYDRQANGVAPALADVLLAANYISPRNLNNRKRFKILMDHKVVINAVGESGSQSEVSFYRKLRHPVEFNAGNAGTVADIQSGSLYLLTVGNAGAGVTAGSFNFYTRVRFTDV